VYSGPRTTSPLSNIDVRDLEWGGHLNIRLRKTF